MIRNILTQSPKDAWEAIRNYIVSNNNDKDISRLENILAGSAWDLWNTFAEHNPSAIENIIGFYETQSIGAAALILDALSLRELPLLIDGANKRRLNIMQSGIYATVLPAETTVFANALGFSLRSDLERGKTSKLLPDVYTFSSGLPFADCEISPQVKILYWHQFPDSILHNARTPETFKRDVKQKLTSDDFWQFVDRLLTGRKLLITSDHGYAITNDFVEINDSTQHDEMKQIYGQKRFEKLNANTELVPSTPPLELALNNYRFALGRRKWRASGGYPALQHGGLSLMECFTPFVILTK
ncbi:MAG: hypothetical protein LBC20_04040 [Planctomycetaceae bacterium]|jgi:hypothetical protein|nr:hypothetical protein [Planctomycetaceae bacterium]